MKRVKTVVEFEHLLQDHDWYYAFSDDKRYYVTQKAMEEQITALSETNRLWRDLYLLYCEAASPISKMTEDEFLSKRNQLMEDYLS